MGWQDLLATTEERTFPWAGGKMLSWGSRTWDIKGKTPPEHGWFKFAIDGSRQAVLLSTDIAEPDDRFETVVGHRRIKGYLVGDRLIPDSAQVNTDPDRMIEQTIPVSLVEPGLDRFTRAVAIKTTYGTFYVRQEFPQGAEEEVTAAYQDGKESLDGIKGVTPALELAFKWTRQQVILAAKRAEEARKRREESEKKRVAAEKMAQAVKSLGTGAGRRAMAEVDFPAAAKAALAVSGAELLDARPSRVKGEWVVQYRFRQRRLECVCDTTMHIIDAGVCLDDHRGTKGDTFFTLESLPAVIAEAMRLGKLVVWRHVAGDPGHGGDGWGEAAADDDDGWDDD